MTKQNAIAAWVMLTLLVSLTLPAGSAASQRRVQEAKPLQQAARDRLSSSDGTATPRVYSEPPVYFEENQGQFDQRVRFVAREAGSTFFFTPQEMVVVLSREAAGDGPGPNRRDLSPEARFRPASEEPAGIPPEEQIALRVRFVFSTARAQIVGQEPLAAKVNHFIGKDPANWQQGVPTYGSILYRNLYPGTDLRYRGTGGRLKYDLLLHPGAQVGRISLAYAGADQLRVNSAGQLEIETAWGTLVEEAPLAWQDGPLGLREAVDVHYEVGPEGWVGFQVGAYDPTRLLVIDPTLRYGTYLGGKDKELSHGLALDGAGNVYVTGSTQSFDFPTTSGAYERNDSGSKDVYVSKLSADGSQLLFSTFVGGSDDEDGYGLALDAASNVLVTGFTASSNFPTSSDAFDRGHNGGEKDVFILRLSADGGTLQASTYVGGVGEENAYSIAPSGSDIVVSGYTGSGDFPTTPGAYDRGQNGDIDAFVLKLASDGSELKFSTLVGGSNEEIGWRLALDSAGNPVIGGYTGSADFPTTAGAYDRTANGNQDAYIAVLSADGSSLLRSTFVGGTGDELSRDFVLDGADNVIVTGPTDSPDFPTSSGAYERGYAGSRDFFVMKLAANLGSLPYSTYVGGGKDDYARGVGLDDQGNVVVVGDTASSDFPTTSDALDRVLGGDRDAVLLQMSSNLSALLYSTYLGGSQGEQAHMVRMWNGSDAIVFGHTESTGFPTTSGAYDTGYNGGQDAFVVQLDGFSGGSITCYTLDLGVEPSDSGWVDDAPPPNCPHDADKYVAGTEVQLEARPYSGWAFSYWSGDISGTANPTTVRMDGNRSVTAHFEQPTCHTLTTSVDPSGSGTIHRDPEPNCGFDQYTDGSQVALTAAARPGYRFDFWSGAATGPTNPTTIWMDGDRAVQARFEEFDAVGIYLPTICRKVFIDPHEPNDRFAEAWGPLESGATLQSFFPVDADEHDYFYFQMPARHSVEVWLTDLPAGQDYDLYLYDDQPPHELVGYSAGEGNVDEHIPATDLPAGRYYVRVLRVKGVSQYQPYHLRAVYD
jgi:hypothetical protein